MGVFPEQASSWAWLRDTVSEVAPPCRCLDLFAYTGASTLAAAAAGAAVTHVDSARGVVTWARRNAALNALPLDQVRWIVEDARSFVRREVRRGHRYQGIVLDPPTYGRAGRGQVWRLEDDLAPLLGDCRRLLAPGAAFLLLTAHSPGLSALALSHLLGLAVDPGTAGRIEYGDLVIPAPEHPLPSGIFARWRRPA
jgi:23S rRNA (cytosine1962-C5)-methyltransferase